MVNISFYVLTSFFSQIFGMAKFDSQPSWPKMPGFGVGKKSYYSDGRI